MLCYTWYDKAHFCEHMLFLGTELYPEEDSFSKFLSVNGGVNNAFTDSEVSERYIILIIHSVHRLSVMFEICL